MLRFLRQIWENSELKVQKMDQSLKKIMPRMGTTFFSGKINGIGTNEMQNLWQMCFHPLVAVLSYLKKNSKPSLYNKLSGSKVLQLK